MIKFPKKYNYKNLYNLVSDKSKQSKQSPYNEGANKVYSSLFPGDQKLHPWCIFSLFFQNTVLGIDKLKNINNRWDLGFWLSSNFYSKLNYNDINIAELESKVLKQSKQNKKYIAKLGLWSYQKREDFVLSEQFNFYLRKVFVDLYQQNKIFLQKEIAYRSKDLQTNLFKNSIKTKSLKVKEYSIKYFVDSKWHAITIPTKSLETIFADVAIAVNPQDKRYKKFIGQKVIIPIVNRIIPIIWDEDIDSFKWSWACRVTPWHDKFGLKLAQKHNLPTDVFAVDTHWNFTEYAGEFAGKKVLEFFDNIVKYIWDIGNLESTKEIIVDKKFNLHTWEALDSIMLRQRAIQYDYALDYLTQRFESDEFMQSIQSQKDELLSMINQKQIVNISTKSTKWLLIPILTSDKWDVFPINDDVIIDKYRQSKSNKDLTLTLIITNLILDNHLSNNFSIEELIDVLFFVDLSSEATRIEKYLSLYQSRSLDDKLFGKWLKDIQKLLLKLDKNSEKIQVLNDLLLDNFAIIVDEDNIELDFSQIFQNDIFPNTQLSLQCTDGFNKSFIDSVWFLYKNKLPYNNEWFQNIQEDWSTLFLSLDQKDFLLNTILLWLEYSKKLLFSNVVFHPILLDIKWTKIVNSNSKFLIKDFGEKLDTYWPDAMRLVLLLSEKYAYDDANIDANLIWGASKSLQSLLFDTYKAQEYSQLLKKIWNATRYVHSKYVWEKWNIKIQNLIKNINSDITDYDLWIVHNLKTILEDYSYQVGEWRYLELANKILFFCKETLCDKYLESTKIYSQENTSNVIILSFAFTLRLIKPFIPEFIDQLERRLWVDRWDYNIFDFKDFELLEKNYKINLFMDIVDKLKKLKLKIWSRKHESINVFVQANPEFLWFLSETENLLKSLVNIFDLFCIRLHEETPTDYETDNVLNINIGIKSHATWEVKKDILVELQSERSEKLEHLQHLKSLVASVLQSWNWAIIAQKKSEIMKLQQEVESLDFEISVLKAK